MPTGKCPIDLAPYIPETRAFGDSTVVQVLRRSNQCLIQRALEDGSVVCAEVPFDAVAELIDGARRWESHLTREAKNRELHQAAINRRQQEKAARKAARANVAVDALPPAENVDKH
jgi:hypothetical protein